MMRPSRLVVGLTVPLAALGLMACQDTTKVVIDNRCGTAIEADANDVADPVALGYKIHWRSVPSGDSASLRSVSDRLKVLYVWVRVAGSVAVPEPLTLQVSNLEESGDKLVLTIVGDLCPAQ